MGFFYTRLRLNLHIWNGTKKKIFEEFFCNFLEINTHNVVKNDPKFGNKSLFDANFMELDMKKFSDPETLTFGVWGIKNSLGQFGPKVFGKGLYQAISQKA